jgi:hypothetical protein
MIRNSERSLYRLVLVHRSILSNVVTAAKLVYHKDYLTAKYEYQKSCVSSKSQISAMLKNHMNQGAEINQQKMRWASL